jgi:hypothetical protein
MSPVTRRAPLPEDGTAFAPNRYDACELRYRTSRVSVLREVSQVGDEGDFAND